MKTGIGEQWMKIGRETWWIKEEQGQRKLFEEGGRKGGREKSVAVHLIEIQGQIRDSFISDIFERKAITCSKADIDMVRGNNGYICGLKWCTRHLLKM